MVAGTVEVMYHRKMKYLEGEAWPGMHLLYNPIDAETVRSSVTLVLFKRRH